MSFVVRILQHIQTNHFGFVIQWWSRLDIVLRCGSWNVECRQLRSSEFISQIEVGSVPCHVILSPAKDFSFRFSSACSASVRKKSCLLCRHFDTFSQSQLTSLFHISIISNHNIEIFCSKIISLTFHTTRIIHFSSAQRSSNFHLSVSVVSPVVISFKFISKTFTQSWYFSFVHFTHSKFKIQHWFHSTSSHQQNIGITFFYAVYQKLSSPFVRVKLFSVHFSFLCVMFFFIDSYVFHMCVLFFHDTSIF